jgi:hypothetical protein
MSLYISINTASAQLGNSPINDAITFVAAQAAVEKQQGRIPGGPSLDVTFLLPGQLEKPGFVGMRMGGYTLESETLFFETAVPTHILTSDKAPQYVAVVMQDVVAHANEFFRENDIEFDDARWLEIVQHLTESHSATMAH